MSERMGEGDAIEAAFGEIALLQQRVGAIAEHNEMATYGLTQEIREFTAAVAKLAKRVEKIDPQDGALVREPAAWVDRANPQEWIELTEWVKWLQVTYDLRQEIRPCWPVHLGAAEELAALREAWRAAAAAAEAPRPGDSMVFWHDRWLPGVLDRIQNRWLIRCKSNHDPHPKPPVSAAEEHVGAALERAAKVDEARQKSAAEAKQAAKDAARKKKAEKKARKAAKAARAAADAGGEQS